ncbi:MAG: DUF4260 domain-containing protein [Chloroflexi bacterium]|nr:DUF4260 domain-containing protein [Chloroflexota bacterium]
MEPDAGPVAAPDHVHLEDTTPWVRRWLRAEGVVAFIGGIALWLILDQPWPLFVVLLFVPDVSMLGYVSGPHAGAIAYNVAHNWATAGGLLLLGFVAEVGALILAGTVLLAHVGIDRALGYGLKYPTSFQDTHLGRIGRRR